MANVDTNEYATVLSVLMECARYPRIKGDKTLSGNLNKAIQIWKQSNSKNSYTEAKPTGGSVRIVDTEKIKGLFDMFHIDK